MKSLAFENDRNVKKIGYPEVFHKLYKKFEKMFEKNYQFFTSFEWKKCVLSKVS